MKTDIETLKDTFALGYETYEPSIKEAKKVLDYYHNRQYTNQQLNTLANRGQPAETFNVVKMFGRMLQGYYATVLNTVKVKPHNYRDIPTAGILNDLVSATLRLNNFDATGDNVKLDGMLAGLMCVFIDVRDTDEVDPFGRTLKEIKLEGVSPLELVLDPMSAEDDYSDARFIHRYKWVSEDSAKKLFSKEKLKELEAHYNHLSTDESEFSAKYGIQFMGKYKVFDNYLIVHTIIEDDDGKTWSKFWSGDVILAEYEVTHKEVKNPYRVQKLHTSHLAEFYGIMREVMPAQDAINQALLKIQLMASTQKAFIEDGAVEDIDEFTNTFNRINAVIGVKSLAGIKIQEASREVLDQYTIIDKALDRIKMLLGINDSFLGMAFASDSGRKVKLQQNSTIVALRYITGRFEQLYKLLGLDMVNLIKQYYTANQVVRIADDINGDRWLELNRPMMQWSGRQHPLDGSPIMVPVMEEKLDPATNEPMTDSLGNIILAPVPTEDTDIEFARVDIEMETASFNDEDEKNQLMLETFLNGTAGQLLSQANPAGFFQASSLNIKSIKSKYSPQISQILEQTAQMLSPQAQQQMQEGEMQGQQGGGQSPMSQTMKLPQNTNEGA